MLRKFLALMAALTVLLGLSSAARADDVTTLKIGTMAPKNSPWGQVFTVWQKGLSQRTGGKLEVEFYWNGTQGDEILMSQKLGNGQLDGAAMTATGLSQFSKSILALQLPGWNGGDWGKVDAARNALMPMLTQEFSASKVVLVGTGDVGLAHIMSIGAPVKGPNDMKGLGPFHLPSDVIGKTFLTKLGVADQSVAVPEILPKLGGAIKVINAPALAAEQLQWASKITHINTMVTGAGVGGLVFAKQRLDGLPADLRDALMETGKVAGQALTGRIRREDAAAYERIKKKLGDDAVYNPNAGDLAQFQALFSQVRAEVCGGQIKAEACALVK
ncbi:MAG: TRAP transporter substrate-binding protein DctP [Polyangiaceae bacterium]